MLGILKNEVVHRSAGKRMIYMFLSAFIIARPFCDVQKRPASQPCIQYVNYHDLAVSSRMVHRQENIAI